MRKLYEWKYIFIVVLLLYLNCIGIYVFVGFNWGYRRVVCLFYVVVICLVVVLGVVCMVGIYNSFSFFGKDFVFEDEDDEVELVVDRVERGELIVFLMLFYFLKKYRFFERRMIFVFREGKVVNDF